jgi:hypothetical protein
VDLFSDAKQDILQAHLSLDSSKATRTPDYPEKVSRSITKPPVMSNETLHLKAEIENVKRLVSVLDCKLYFKNWLCDYDAIRTLDTHNFIYDKQNYASRVDRVAFLRGKVARNK